nr:putative late blight resistance protein homolog R1A-10 [Ipomoea batatas]
MPEYLLVMSAVIALRPTPLGEAIQSNSTMGCCGGQPAFGFLVTVTKYKRSGYFVSKIKIQGQGPEECVEDVEKANSEIKMEDGDESLAGADGRVCRGRNWIWEIEVMGKILFRVHVTCFEIKYYLLFINY